jgi:hypothetical protein
MRGTLQLILSCVITMIASVGLTLFIFTNFIYRPVVVVDLGALVNDQRAATQGMDVGEATERIGAYFATVSRNINKRREIVLVKEAVINADTVKDITLELEGEIP